MDQMNSAPNQNTKSATIPSDKTSQINIKNTDQTEKNILIYFDKFTIHLYLFVTLSYFNNNYITY